MHSLGLQALLPKSFKKASQVPTSKSVGLDSLSDWTLVHDGDAQQHLLREVEKLYWKGVEWELQQVLFTLVEWLSASYADVELSDEADDHIHGFDTFVDQVAKHSQTFAQFVHEQKAYEERYKFAPKTWSYEESSRRHAFFTRAQLTGAEIRLQIRQNLEKPQVESKWRQRTRILLLGMGLLDIEKLVDHRPRLEGGTFWDRPAIPQLSLSKFTGSGVPIFKFLECSMCSHVIRGSMFCKCHKADGDMKPIEKICEDCYRDKHLGNPDYIKTYKHCVLTDAITSDVSHKLCWCKNVKRFDEQGQIRALFPVCAKDEHRKASRLGSVQCGLLSLPMAIAEVKNIGLQKPNANGGRRNRKKMEEFNLESDITDSPHFETAKVTSGPKIITKISLHNPKKKSVTTGTTIAVEEPEADDDIPFFLRKYTEKYPFGNVHMALRIGPIVIENGVKNTKGGALISVRDGLLPHFSNSNDANQTQPLALSGEHARQLWRRKCSPPQAPKRFKAIMKQVVGTPFTGILDENLEDRIIDRLLEASESGVDDPGLRSDDRQELLRKYLNPCMQDLRTLIGPHVRSYLQSITSRLLDESKTTLKWSQTSNNCQNFCDALVDQEIFGPLISTTAAPSTDNGTTKPLYLFSFVCRPAGYARPKVRSKFDVPQGLTEEYLLKFRHGRHDDSDIIDTLQEYWHDWGAFGRSLYKYQDLFPWDCTEAFGRYPVTCGDCNLAKHLWAFPFDSWSIISLHLTRDRYSYPSPRPDSTELMSNKEWMHNRLLLLSGLQKLTAAAVAMRKTKSFRDATLWLHMQTNPARDRLKLGGIHRAQPFSHYYDHGNFNHYFTASWAHLSYEGQLAEYESLRDGRVKLPDVEFSKRLYDGEYNSTSPSDYDRMDLAMIAADAAFIGIAIDNGQDGGDVANCGTGCAADAGADDDDGGGGDGGCGGCGGCCGG